MEVATTTPKPTQIPRGASLSPNCDVWATSEVGIPLSELANSVRGRKPPETLALTIPAVSDASPDSWLGSDLRMLFKENSPVCVNDFSPEVERPGTEVEGNVTVSLIVSDDMVNGKVPLSERNTETQAVECVSVPQNPKIVLKASLNQNMDSGQSPEIEGTDQRRSSAIIGNGNEAISPRH